tara:strand:- start:670 stop:1335 length:666 start_codon:yes stop_codon:yes gene_type:complete
LQKILIYGNGKVAKILFQFLKKNFHVEAFTVDEKLIKQKYIEGLPLVGFEKIHKKFDTNDYKMIIAVGYSQMNCIREQKYKEAKFKGYSFINYIHPSVEIHENVKIGKNNIILDHVAIQPYASIGNSNFLWSNSVIGHGSAIRDYNWIASGAVISGDAIVKSKCFFGVNASIGHNVTVENENFIGANTLITKNTGKKNVFISQEGQKFRAESKQFLKFTGA